MWVPSPSEDVTMRDGRLCSISEDVQRSASPREIDHSFGSLEADLKKEEDQTGRITAHQPAGNGETPANTGSPTSSNSESDTARSEPSAWEMTVPKTLGGAAERQMASLHRVEDGALEKCEAINEPSLCRSSLAQASTASTHTHETHATTASIPWRSRRQMAASGSTALPMTPPPSPPSRHHGGANDDDHHHLEDRVGDEGGYGGLTCFSMPRTVARDSESTTRHVDASVDWVDVFAQPGDVEDAFVMEMIRKHYPVSMDLFPSSEGGTYIVKAKGSQLHRHESSQSATATTLMRESSTIGVFKPTNEEIGQEQNPHGNTESERADEFIPGSGSKREVLAYLLDHKRSARVPLTLEVQSNDGRVGSFQKFVPGCVDAGNVLPGRFGVDDVHRLAIFDIRVLNCDRHGGNILVRTVQVPTSEANVTPLLGRERSDSHRPRAPSPRRSCNKRADTVTVYQLIPIDHSYICPSGYHDPDFEWMTWPQAKEPFSAASLAYIAELSATEDAALTRKILEGDDAHDCGEKQETAIFDSFSSSQSASSVRSASNSSMMSSHGSSFGAGDESSYYAEAAAEVVACATRVLQIGALEFNLTARDIARLCRRETLTRPSALEELMGNARGDLDQGSRINLKLFDELLRTYLQDVDMSD